MLVTARKPRRRRQLGAVKLSSAVDAANDVALPLSPDSSVHVDRISQDDSGHIRGHSTVETVSPVADSARWTKRANHRKGPTQGEEGQSDGAWSLLQRSLRKISDTGAASGSLGAAVVDKSLDAVKDLGRAAVDMANTLDTAIEQLLGSWSAPWLTSDASQQTSQQPGGDKRLLNSDKRLVRGALREVQHQANSMRASEGKSQTRSLHEQSQGENHRDKENVEPYNCLLAAPSSSKAAAGKEQLREHLQKLREDVKRYSRKCSTLAEENRRLRGAGHPSGDVLDEQVRAQVEALLAEKARLAQENARLLRENGGLQELLQLTMQSQLAPVDDESVSSLSGEEWECTTDLEPAELCTPPSDAVVANGHRGPCMYAKANELPILMSPGQLLTPKTPLLALEPLPRHAPPT